MEKLTESKIVSAINSYLMMIESQGKILFMRCNSGAVFSEYKGKKRMWRAGKKGWSDFIVWRSIKRFINQDGLVIQEPALDTYFLEVKTPQATQMKDQIDFMDKVFKLGGQYCVVHDIEEVKKILDL